MKGDRTNPLIIVLIVVLVVAAAVLIWRNVGGGGGGEMNVETPKPPPDLGQVDPNTAPGPKPVDLR